MRTSKLILILFIGLIFGLFIPQTIFCQAEKLDIIQYTPPKGWTKTPKEGAVVYSDINKTTNAFCLITLYSSTAAAGTPQLDFTNEWNNLVVKPFKAQTNPKTETQTNPEGWQATAGAAEIEIDGVKSYAILTVFSGFGKTTSVLAILNDQTYVAQLDAVTQSIKLDKVKVVADMTPTPTIQNDPFPDRPGYAPQKPLMGTLKETITMADLVGGWDSSAASVQTYVDSSSGNYAGTNTTFYGDLHSINANGSFDYKFTGRTNNHTVRESDSGNVILSGGTITLKFKGRSTYKYQLIAFMTQPNGSAILSLVQLSENAKEYDSEWLKLECGHGSGYIHCVGGEEWARPAAKPVK